jgi:hypothetical protein
LDYKGNFALRLNIVAGDLDLQWSHWFGGLSVIHNQQGETLIRGPIKDQSELYGVLNKFRDLGITLISLRKIDLEM